MIDIISNIQQGLKSKVYLALFIKEKSISELSRFIYNSENHRYNISNAIKELKNKGFVKIHSRDKYGSIKYAAEVKPVLDSMTEIQDVETDEELKEMINTEQKWIDKEKEQLKKIKDKEKRTSSEYGIKNRINSLNYLKRLLKDKNFRLSEFKRGKEKYGFDTMTSMTVDITKTNLDNLFKNIENFSTPWIFSCTREQYKTLKKILESEFLKGLVDFKLHEIEKIYIKPLDMRSKKSIHLSDISINAFEIIKYELIKLFEIKIYQEIFKILGEDSNLQVSGTDVTSNLIEKVKKLLSEFLDSLDIETTLKFLKCNGNEEICHIYSILINKSLNKKIEKPQFSHLISLTPTTESIGFNLYET